MVPWMQVISTVSLGIQHTPKSLWSSGEAPWRHFELLIEEQTQGNSDTRGEGTTRSILAFPSLPCDCASVPKPKTLNLLLGKSLWNLIVHRDFIINTVLTIRLTLTGTKGVIEKDSFHCTQLNSCCPGKQFFSEAPEKLPRLRKTSPFASSQLRITLT